MTEPSDSPPSGNRAANTNEIDDAILGDVARKAYADRRRREHITGADGMFGEPAWDILLELFIAARENREVLRAGAHAGAGVPETIAQRWITILENRGLVVGEGAHIRLSAATCTEMADYFRKS
ncbi:MAG: hypothetical protein QM676_09860 [Novosphingobium sp.]